jgi:hypothetical protein
MQTLIRWEQANRLSWSRVHHLLMGTVHISGQTHEVTTRPHEARGRIYSGHVLVDDLDLQMRPGQTLIIGDPLDPASWRVADLLL